MEFIPSSKVNLAHVKPALLDDKQDNNIMV